MNLLNLFIAHIICTSTCFLYSSERPSSRSKANSSFTITKLNYNNSQDVQGACKLFKDPTICHKTGGLDDILTQKSLEDRYENEHHFICKANDGEILGFLAIVIDKNKAEYDTLAVDKNHRRQGIASALIKSAESRMPNSVETIGTSVQHNNQEVIKCFERNGFHLHTNQLTSFMATCCPSCIDTSFFAHRMIKNVNSQKKER